MSTSLIRRVHVLLFTALIGLTGSLIAASSETEYQVVGVLREKLPGDRLLIAHEEIPGYMAAMTMAFDLADPREAIALETGERLRFRLRPLGDRWLVDQFVSLGSNVAPAATPVRVARLRAGDALPPLALLDEMNRPVTRDSLRGQFTVVTFIFTRCPVKEFCPAMALKFGALQSALEQEKPAAGEKARVRLLSITLDPEFDRPAVLAAYGQAVGANPAIWNFATGETADLAKLARQFAVFTERNGVTLDHALCTALIGPDGRVREFWRGNGWTAADILTFVRQQPDYAP